MSCRVDLQLDKLKLEFTKRAFFYRGAKIYSAKHKNRHLKISIVLSISSLKSLFNSSQNQRVFTSN